jgi:hypothetical protein
VATSVPVAENMCHMDDDPLALSLGQPPKQYRAVHHAYRSPLSTTQEVIVSMDEEGGDELESGIIHESFELEEVSSIARTESWRLGMPWFRTAISPATTLGGTTGGSGGGFGLMRFNTSQDYDDSSRSYYGGIMKSQGSYIVSEPATPRTLMQQSQQLQQQQQQQQQLQQYPKTNAVAKVKKKIRSRSIKLFSSSPTAPATPNTTATNPDQQQQPLSKVPSFFRTLSHFSTKSGSSQAGPDSIADFDDSEWTPQDSAYGAAFPIFGCIPKQVRRFIEFTILALLLLGFVYLVVTTSIHITNERYAAKIADQNATVTTATAFEDDNYVEYKNGKGGSYWYQNNKNGASHSCTGDDDGCYFSAYNNDDDYYSANDDNDRRWLML